MLKIRILLIPALFFLSYLLVACDEEKTDEERIVAQIKVLQEAIEAHDSSDFMAVIDSQYSDRLNKTRSSLQKMLLLFFYRYKDISVYVTATKIDLQHIRADAHSQVVLTGGQSLIPENARHYQVKSCWKKVDDEWLLSCLEWQR